MDLVIYGADVSGKRAFEICKKLNLNVVALIDADKNKTGKYLDNVPILGIDDDSIKLITKNVVMMGTNSIDAYDFVCSLTDKVFDINTVNKLFATYGDKNMPIVSLQSKHMHNCRLVPNRIDMLHHLPKNGTVAEVGVFKGDFSQYILDICKPKKLYLIDLWEGKDNGYNLEQCYEDVKQKYKKEIEIGQVELIRSDSVKSLSCMEDNHLDWVYLDTMHDYITPHNELVAVRSKIKENGYICGHDYAQFSLLERIELGVWNAVNEFVFNYNYEFKYLTFEEHGIQSFAIGKLYSNT